MQEYKDLDGRITRIEMTIGEMQKTILHGIGHIMDTLKIPRKLDEHIARLKWGFAWRVEFWRNGYLFAVRGNPHNLVVNTGLTYLLASGVSLTEYIFLTEGAITPAAADTMASHAGWTESTAYDETTRVAWSHNAAASQTVATATPSTFTASATKTMSGAGLCSANDKGGSTGTLITVAPFTGGSQVVDDNDILYVSVTGTATDDGA
jgi:hypothetical protein